MALEVGFKKKKDKEWCFVRLFVLVLLLFFFFLPFFCLPVRLFSVLLEYDG